MARINWRRWSARAENSGRQTRYCKADWSGQAIGAG